MMMPGPNNSNKMEADAPLTDAQDTEELSISYPPVEIAGKVLPGQVIKHIGDYFFVPAQKDQERRLNPSAIQQEHDASADADMPDASASAAANTSSDASEASQTSLQALSALARTNRTFNSIFQPMMSELKQKEVTELVTHVLHGRKKEAEAMIQKNPGLLRASCKAPLVKIAVGADSRNYDNVTAYEAAL